MGTGPTAASAPATVFSSGFKTPGGGMGFVLHNLTEWQAFYSPYAAPPPPVNFATNMVVVVLYQGCFDVPKFTSICTSSGQVTVTILNYISGPSCLTLTTPGSFIAASAPQSSQPVVWQINTY
jgi:hypothetical protein